MPMRNLWLQGGTRDRVFFADRPECAPTLNKLPLVSWRRRYVYVNSTHSMLPPRLNRPMTAPATRGRRVSCCTPSSCPRPPAERPRKNGAANISAPRRPLQTIMTRWSRSRSLAGRRLASLRGAGPACRPWTDERGQRLNPAPHRTACPADWICQDRPGRVPPQVDDVAGTSRRAARARTSGRRHGPRDRRGQVRPDEPAQVIRLRLQRQRWRVPRLPQAARADAAGRPHRRHRAAATCWSSRRCATSASACPISSTTTASMGVGHFLMVDNGIRRRSRRVPGRAAGRARSGGRRPATSARASAWTG